MIQLNNISEYGLGYIALGIVDLMSKRMKSSKEGGCYFEQCWLTPETCYWIYKFLEEVGFDYESFQEVREFLKNGTNHPESL